MNQLHKTVAIAVTALLLHAGVAGAQNPDAKRQQLLELKQLFEEGLISREVYNQQQQLIGGQGWPGQNFGVGNVATKTNLVFEAEDLPPIDFEPLYRYVDVQSIARTDRPPGGMMMGDYIVVLYRGRGILMIPPPVIVAYDGNGVRTATDRIYIEGRPRRA